MIRSVRKISSVTDPYHPELSHISDSVILVTQIVIRPTGDRTHPESSAHVRESYKPLQTDRGAQDTPLYGHTLARIGVESREWKNPAYTFDRGMSCDEDIT